MNRSTFRHSLVRFLGTDSSVYSGRMAIVLCLVISAVLWWIPTLGPAVAGYVCGRKAGSAMKGFFCSLVSGMILVLAILGFSVLILGQGGYPDIPADEAAASLTGFTGTAASYLQTFFAGGTSDINLVSLCTVAAFGAIGGILSGQMRRETAYLLSVGASESPVRPAARSMQLYREGKKLGFESFEDCAAARNAEMNIGRDAGTKRRYTPEKRADLRDAKPEAIVIRTAEAGKSDSTAAGRKESSENPFADILERSDRRKDSR